MKQLTLILVCTLFILTGCYTEKRKNFVVLIDNSTSVPELVMKGYIETIQQTILPNLGDKDRLTVMFIDACSQNKAERIYAFDLAETNFENKTDGINHRKDSSRARLIRYLTETVKNQIAETILAKRKERKNCGNYTDIVNALNESKTLIDNKANYDNTTDKVLNDAKGNANYKYETCLIVFSDMVNENPEKTLDFTTYGKIKEETIIKRIDDLRQMNKIPNLVDVKVLVYGATSTKEAGVFANKQIENVRLFWELFFKSADADLKGYGYDTEIEIKNYLVAK